ncbi:MAG: hypothetical protein LBM19_01195 [Holosporales bacterium]|jgi:hypothetical protein|nr:hypothetical protein [Holosporales bacterium]
MSVDVANFRRKIDRKDGKKSISRHVNPDGSVWEKNFRTGEFYDVKKGDGSYRA